MSAGHPRQHEVEQDDVGTARGERLECCRAVFGDLDVKPLAAQEVGQRVGEIGLVLDDQDAGHSGSPFVRDRARTSLDFFLGFMRRLPFAGMPSGAAMAGRRTVKVDPRPGRDHTSISPP